MVIKRVFSGIRILFIRKLKVLKMFFLKIDMLFNKLYDSVEGIFIMKISKSEI